MYSERGTNSRLGSVTGYHYHGRIGSAQQFIQISILIPTSIRSLVAYLVDYVPIGITESSPFSKLQLKLARIDQT